MENINDEIVKPVSSKERVKELDIIRGFALFGVLMVNMAMFNTTLFTKFASSAPLSHPLQLESMINRLGALFIQIFAEGKFYTIFSFLFGLGFFIFMERATKKQASSNKLFLKRSFFLLIFGTLHFSLVWYGDILHVYGIIGFFLLLFKNASLKTVKTWLIILLVFSTLILSSLTFLDSLLNTIIDTETIQSQSLNRASLMDESVEVYQKGSYLEVVSYRLTNEGPYVIPNFFFIIPKILGMFLIGLYVGKRGILQDIKGNLPFINRVWKIAGVTGLLSTIFAVGLDYQFLKITPLLTDTLLKTSEEIATIFLSLFYVASLTILLQKPKYSKILNPLGYMGQMALTNYLVQCILCSIIFYGYGLGLLNGIGVATGILLTVVIYSLQLLVSKQWLRKFKYGPFEWVWRRLTYGNL